MEQPRAAAGSTAASHAAVRYANGLAGGEVCGSTHFGEGDEQLHLVSAGPGPAGRAPVPTLLFVHGFPSFWYCWQRQLEALRQDFRVVAIDAPGAGASARPDWAGAYRIERLAELLGELITSLAAPVVLVGHDWGAALSFYTAQTRPPGLAGVVGVAAPPFDLFLRLFAEDAEQRERSAYMQRLCSLDLATIEHESIAPKIATGAYAGLVERANISPEEAELFAAAVGDPSALWGGASWYRENLERAISAPAPLAIPAQLIWGEADQTFIAATPNRFLTENPGAEVLRLPGIGHWCMLEAPDAVTAALQRFASNAFAGVAADVR